MVRLRASLAIPVAMAGSASAQQAVPLLAPGEALVQVSATGEVKGTPDIAMLAVGVSADAATSKAALAANAAKADRLVQALHAAGVADAAMKTSDLSVRPRHPTGKDGEEGDAIIGYRASNRLSLRVPVDTAARVIDALGDAGASEIDGPTFAFADPDRLTGQARDAAVRQAQRRARDYADAFGLKTMRVVRVSERSADVDAASDIVVTGSRVSAPVRPGEQAVRVTVWVDYAMTR